jgi:predicted nucleic acid-binding protein
MPPDNAASTDPCFKKSRRERSKTMDPPLAEPACEMLTAGADRSAGDGQNTLFMDRLIAADSSPLIGLATAGAFDLLRQLFGTVMITRLVKDEVTARGDLPGARELNDAMRAGWIRVAAAPPETWQFATLDAGEASTIALAQKRAGALILMDDALGREQAAALGIEVLDVAGLLLAAKQAGLIGSAQPFVARLARRGFTLPEAALHKLAAADAEPPSQHAPELH